MSALEPLALPASAVFVSALKVLTVAFTRPVHGSVSPAAAFTLIDGATLWTASFAVPAAGVVDCNMEETDPDVATPVCSFAGGDPAFLDDLDRAVPAFTDFPLTVV